MEECDTDTYAKLSVFHLWEDGKVHIKQPSLFGLIESSEKALKAMTVKGVEHEVQRIVKAREEKGFRYRERKRACCNGTVPSHRILVVTKPYYITPCYDCEVWPHWSRLMA